MDKELKQLIDNLISKKGGSHNDYRLLMDKIAFHESRINKTAQQKGGGPGRGKYQFETGRYKGGKTASNRAINYYKKNNITIPKWLNNLKNEESVDASKLSSDQQDILFLTNMTEHPKADLGKVISGDEKIEDFWANYHWGGKKSNRPARINAFKTSLGEFKPSISPIKEDEKSPNSYRRFIPNDLYKDIPKDNVKTFQKFYPNININE